MDYRSQMGSQVRRESLPALITSQ